MGRLADLCGTIAAEADETRNDLSLPPEIWDQLRNENWTNSDIQDAIEVVRDSFLQSELVDAADSLSARLIELLGEFSEVQVFERIAAGGTVFSVEILGQLVRRVERLEEVLDAFREGATVDRRRFDDLRRRLDDYGIEDVMRRCTSLPSDDR